MYTNIFGKNIYYEVYGSGQEKVLLYLHGGPGASCLDFANQARALGEKLRVVIFDQMGVLRSDAIGGEEEYGMERQIEMCEELRRLLGVEKWSVLGHSYGGMLAALYSFRYPDSVDRVILECPSLDFPDSVRSIARFMSGYIDGLGDEAASGLCARLKTVTGRDSSTMEELVQLLGYIKDKELRNYLHGVSYEEYARTMDTEGITSEMWSRSNNHLKKLLEEAEEKVRNGIFSEKRASMLDDFLPMLQNTASPVLLISGKYDPVCTERQKEYLTQNVRNFTDVEFENSGHFPRIEEAEKYTDTVLRFMEA